MTAFLDEAQVEIAAVDLLKAMGYEYAFGPDNGLPLAVIELKNPADENATLRAAENQIHGLRMQKEPKPRTAPWENQSQLP